MSWQDNKLINAEPCYIHYTGKDRWYNIQQDWTIQYQYSDMCRQGNNNMCKHIDEDSKIIGLSSIRNYLTPKRHGEHKWSSLTRFSLFSNVCEISYLNMKKSLKFCYFFIFFSPGNVTWGSNKWKNTFKHFFHSESEKGHRTFLMIFPKSGLIYKK